MNIKDIFLTASGNMFRSKVRTVLTILAIFVGAFTLTLTNGLGAGVATYIDRQVSNLGQEALVIITPKVEMATTKSPQEYEPGTINGGGARPGEQVTYLTQGDADKLRQYDGITNVELIYVTSPDYIQGASDKKYQLTASPNPASTRLDLAAGEQLATDTDENQLVIPIEYVTPLGYADANAAINQQVTLAVTDGAGERHDVLATIVGVQQEGPLSAGGMAMSTALKTALYDLQSRGLPAATKDRYQGVAAEMKGDLTDQRVADIKSALDVMGYTAQTIDDQLGVIQTVISAITYVLSGFAVVALLAAGFGIVNTLLMSVQERTKEIGLMKAMGMRSGRIFLLFSIEAMLIGFWGSMIGVFAAVGAGAAINAITSSNLLADLPGLQLILVEPTSALLIIALIMIIAFIAGTLPAVRAARQNPIDALRYE